MLGLSLDRNNHELEAELEAARLMTWVLGEEIKGFKKRTNARLLLLVNVSGCSAPSTLSLPSSVATFPVTRPRRGGPALSCSSSSFSPEISNRTRGFFAVVSRGGDVESASEAAALGSTTDGSGIREILGSFSSSMTIAAS